MILRLVLRKRMMRFTPKSRIVTTIVTQILPWVEEVLTCDQAFFFRRSAKEKQRETQRSVGDQSGFSQARKRYAFFFLPFPDRDSRVAILSRSSEKRTPQVKEVRTTTNNNKKQTNKCSRDSRDRKQFERDHQCLFLLAKNQRNRNL